MFSSGAESDCYLILHEINGIGGNITNFVFPYVAEVSNETEPCSFKTNFINANWREMTPASLGTLVMLVVQPSLASLLAVVQQQRLHPIGVLAKHLNDLQRLVPNLVSVEIAFYNQHGDVAAE